MGQRRVLNFERSSQRSPSHEKKKITALYSAEKLRGKWRGLMVLRLESFRITTVGVYIQGYMEMNAITGNNLNL